MQPKNSESFRWDKFFAGDDTLLCKLDVRDLGNDKDEMKFYCFMVTCAARSGELFDASDVARVAEVDQKTAKAWLSVLQASGIVRLLEPFWPSVDKRLTKTPKL